MAQYIDLRYAHTSTHGARAAAVVTSVARGRLAAAPTPHREASGFKMDELGDRRGSGAGASAHARAAASP